MEPPESSTQAINTKPSRTPPVDYEIDDDLAALLNPDEEDPFADLWKLLEEDTASPTKVTFPSVPQAQTALYLPSDAYLTITGTNESCGSLFSERDSSVMASFDLAGLCGGAWGEYALGGDVEVVMDGCDSADEYDWMLARFLCEEEAYERVE